jgi:hypothetical protein
MSCSADDDNDDYLVHAQRKLHNKKTVPNAKTYQKTC